MKNVISIAVFLVAAAACSNKDQASKSGRAAPAAGSASVVDKVPSESEIAYSLGRKVGMLEMYALMNKPEKATDTLEGANTLASGLGLTAITMPHKGERPDRPLHEQLLAKTTPKVADAFLLGHAITYAWFGAQLGASTVGDTVAGIETLAKQAGVPDAVWRAQYDKVKAKPSADDIDALGKLLHAYFKG